MTNSRFRTSLIAMIALGLAGTASAQAPQGQGPMMGPGIGPGMMGRGMMGPGMMGMGGMCPMLGMTQQGEEAPPFIEGRLAFLKAEIGITEPQQAAWNAYSEALKKNLQSMAGMRQTMITAMAGKTPVERLEAHLTAMESRQKALQELKPALTKLYEALDAEQKKKADQILTGMGCMM